MYDRSKRESQTRRSIAVEKAMNMKIKKVPWWNKRTRLERRLILTTLSLLLVISCLIAAIVLTVQSFNTQIEEKLAESQTLESLKKLELVIHDQQKDHEAEQNSLPQKTNNYIPVHKESKYCLTKECIQTAADLTERMDTNADPCQDFYQFACGGYVEKTIIPEDRSRTSMFSDVGDKLNEQIKGMLEKPILNLDPKPYHLAKSLYQSCMDTANIESRGIQPLLSIMKAMGGWPLLEGPSWEQEQGGNFRWYEQVWRFRDFGYSVDYLLDFSVTVDLKNSSWRVLDLDQPSLGLSREYLLRGLRDPQVAAYFTYMVQVASLLGADQEQAESQMLEVLILETQLANISLSREQRRDSTGLYNPMSVQELSKLDPDTPWLEHFNRLLTSDIVQVSGDELVIVDAPSYITELASLLRLTPARVQANYLMWRAAAASLSYLNAKAEIIRLRFSSRMTGKTELPPRWMKCVSTTISSLPNAVGSMYVSQYFNGGSKEEALEMVGEIRFQFDQMLRDTDWMDEATKSKAIDKANSMVTHIGYPQEILDMEKLTKLYSGLELNADDFYGNALRTTMFGTSYAFSKLRDKVDKLDWVRHGRPAVVNAFYSPLENSIQFPAGILQGVFFNSQRPKYMNYGAIGWVIGHEITHGFDDQGRQFDKNGNLMDWWEGETREKFQNKTKCIIDQYSNYTLPLPKIGAYNVHINGVSTQGENIADNGGIKVAYRAYNAWVSRNGEESPLPGLGFTQSQLFWISGASVWCAKYRDVAMKMRIMSGVHSPDRFRVQGPFSNMEEFSKDFQCKLGSKMNQQREKCVLW